MIKVVLNYLTLFIVVLAAGCFGGKEQQAGGIVSGNLSSFAGISSVNEITDSTARINWAHNSNGPSVNYIIYDVTLGLDSSAQIASVYGPATGYQLTGLTHSTSYVFMVRAVDTNGNTDRLQFCLPNHGLIPEDYGFTQEEIDAFCPTTNVFSTFTTNNEPDTPSEVSVYPPFNSLATPRILVRGVKAGDTIKLFTDSNCLTEVGSAVSTGSYVSITTSSLAAATHTLYANSTNVGGETSTCSTANLSYTVLVPNNSLCPSGYVLVPENTQLGVSQFCVMQYEAKNDSGNPKSQATGYPWTSISQADAKAKCTTLGTDYDLISNPEWITIARNIEGLDFNYSLGRVGHSSLFQGNNGLWASLSGYIGATPEQGAGRSIKARHFLSNGAEIWDLSGNVSEWVDWTQGGGLSAAPTSCSGAHWTMLSGLSCSALSNDDYLPLNPSGQHPSSYYGLGYGGFYAAGDGAAARGGSWDDQVYAGIFAINLNNNSTSVASDIGFRCVYRL